MDGEVASTIGHIAGVVAVAIVVPWFLGRLRSAARAESDGQRLCYPWGFKIVALAVLAVAAALLWGSFQVDPDDRRALLYMAIGFGALGLPLTLEGFLVSMTFDAAEIRCRSAWRRNRVIRIDDIVDISYSRANSWHLLHTKSQGFVRVSDLIGGGAALIDHVRSKTNIQEERQPPP